MSGGHHIVVFRFSSLGDVAMTVPVIKNLLHQHPQLELTMVSNAFHAPLFAGIERLHFLSAELKGKHKGFAGLYRLFRELKAACRIDAVADLHQVLRTRILKIYFQLAGIRWAAQDKGRKEKKELTRFNNKILKPLPSTFERYAAVFATLGYPIQLNIADGLQPKGTMPASFKEKVKGRKLVGIAPFAQFTRKTYPPDKMKAVIRMIAAHQDVQVFLFGGRADLAVLQQWTTEIEGLEIVAGSMSFSAELDLIGQLQVMVSMDSANMHLASLYGVPVVSIWGATHPYAGFYGWGQHPGNAVQIDLACRPCSVFGNKPGPRPDLACMEGIAPMAVYNKVMSVLSGHDF